MLFFIVFNVFYLFKLLKIVATYVAWIPYMDCVVVKSPSIGTATVLEGLPAFFGGT